jgi:nucleoside-diphosphate-sugar epimerase
VPAKVLVSKFSTIGFLCLGVFRRGTYIGSGENRYSAIHLEDLAALYCLVLKKARSTRLVHAAGENFSVKEVATSIHRAMRFKGELKSISVEENS